ncbi:MAG TPA: 2TM domain-containing protein [Hydrogenophaga sp.]|uniref:2TM domain-containing protein n=1 Tax=Hydrogenophaga sp. TaxID=1904254 RepID=UPI002C60C1AD|nr:2TM domain-containing protein [Hydrogenophaga sp.]HMN93318.1 2TM domain-containing protein [Hydrogenophaga sp.]
MNSSPHTQPDLPADLERIARRRAGAKLGFYTHAFVYAVVIAGLGLLALSQGKTWMVWPAVGWGFGLMMHGVGVYGIGPGSSLREHLTERERQALRAQPRGPRASGRD